MGFLFRFDQIRQTEDETILTGSMLSGELSCLQRVDVQSAEEEAKSVFSAPLRGVAQAWLDDHQPTVLTDLACWDNSFELLQQTAGQQQLHLILHGPAPVNLPTSGIAWGVDEKPPLPPELASALQAYPGDAALRIEPGEPRPPFPSLPSGAPLRQYPYQIDRRQIILYAPWFLFLTLSILIAVGLVAFWNHDFAHVEFMKWASFALFGLIDVFLLLLSLKMLFTPRSHIVVTTTGMLLPIFFDDLSSKTVFIPFSEMQGMLEFWQRSSVRLIKLKTSAGEYLINVFLIDRAHFEELHRLLWGRIHEERALAEH